MLFLKKKRMNIHNKIFSQIFKALLLCLCTFWIYSSNQTAAVCYAKTNTDKEKVEEFVAAYYKAHTEEGMETLPDYVEDAENAAEEMMILEVCLECGVEKYDNLDIVAYPLSDGISWLVSVNYDLMVKEFDGGIPGATAVIAREQEDGTYVIWGDSYDDMSGDESKTLRDEMEQLTQSDEVRERIADVNDRYGTLMAENPDIMEWVLDLSDELTRARVTQTEDSYAPKTEAEPEPETGMGITYIVCEADSLWSIAEAELGDGMCWSSIYEANRSLIGDDPNLIYVGWELEIEANTNSVVIDDSDELDYQTEAMNTSIEEDRDWRKFDFTGKAPSYYFFSNAYQWAYHLSNESTAAIAICAYAEDDSEEGTWELRSMRTRYTDQEWVQVFFACSEKGRELYILLRELPYEEPEYLVMADGIQGTDGSYSYDSSLTWKTYQSQPAYSEKNAGYTIYVSSSAYVYDSTYIDESVNAMTDYLVSTQADQEVEWCLLDDLIYIGEKSYLADMSFSNGMKRVHMMIDVQNKQYSVVEVYDTQEKNIIPIDLQTQADRDDLYLGGTEADFFANAHQWHYDPQAEKAAACAVKDYAKKIGVADEEWELTHMYSEYGAVGVVARAKSPDRRLSLLIKGNTYQVIADVHKGDSGEYDLSNGYSSYDSEMKWHSYYEWTINGEKENESVYTVHCNEGYYQHDSIYDYQLHRAMQEYLSSVNADPEEEWEMLPEKLFVGCHGSLADAWYTNGSRRVHLVVDVWNKTYTVIVGEDVPEVSIVANDLSWSKAPEEVTVSDNNDTLYQIVKKTKNMKAEKENFIDISDVDYPVIEIWDEAVNKEVGGKINNLLYDMAMYHYDQDLEQEVNAFYACQYFITAADENYICIYYIEYIGSGMGRPVYIEDAVTISLKTGDAVPLGEFVDTDNIMERVKNYTGTIYTDTGIEQWIENKEKFTEEWKKREDAFYHGYYLYNGRIGFFFDYYRTGRERIAVEFEGMENPLRSF